jgi:protein-S-isoprenylcysteine O-methyltransferase Ste14
VETRIPPPVIDGLALLAVLLLWKFAPSLQIDAPLEIAIAVGSLLIFSGLSMSVLSAGLFKKKKTTVLPFKPQRTSALVTDGFYRFTRNPMYLGMALVVLGAIFITRQPVGLLALFAACAYLTKFQIKPEEKALEQIFGQEFLDYKSRVRRWI